MKISVVVPVYRSSGTLPLLVDELAQVLPNVADAFELVLTSYTTIPLRIARTVQL